MSGSDPKSERDWRDTLFMPKTEFPMKAGLPKREPELLARWAEIGIHDRLRDAGDGRPSYILHDGPPYANGHLHIGHALNKVLKDVVVRSQQMMGHNANYVPGWDCHGLPIEWKIEEQYRKKGKDKDEVPVLEFRKECREFAQHWLDVQSDEFQRLGVVGDWENPYATMHYSSEAAIANELLKFAMNGLLYQGSKPVMWSVVERTALAEAEVEYHDHESPTIWVKFPVVDGPEALKGASVVIWTTTPWTIPANRAIAYSRSISYGLYEVTDAAEDNWGRVGDRFILADALAESVREAARIDAWTRVADVAAGDIKSCAHPLRGVAGADGYYDFDVVNLPGDYVTEDAGTGFVHTAPGHGADDYGLFVANRDVFADAGITEVPHSVQEDGHYYPHVALFGGDTPKRVINDKGKFGDANGAVIDALVEAGGLLARGRLKHTYPHSWRSKAPVIFRNTPQWFIAMDKVAKIDGTDGNRTLREIALQAIEDTAFTPPSGQNRLHAMIAQRPDWVISRQRAWGVPIAVFLKKGTNDYIPSANFAKSDELIARIREAFVEEGADAWFKEGAKERFLDGLVDNTDDYEQVMDILDVWFESGSTHAFVLEDRDDLSSPAQLYLEGSDQHRGWFHSSLLESSGTRGRAPYEGVLTHGFVMAEDGRKMSKSLNNSVEPQKVIDQYGAEILRLWVVASDYSEDLRIGPEIIKSSADAYRKMRNTLRFLLGNLAYYEPDLAVEPSDMPDLERYMLHRLAELDVVVRDGYVRFDFKKVFHTLSNFCIGDLSAFYLDIRKDALYCEPYDSLTRRSALTVMDHVFECLSRWLAPMLCFTAEEAWLARKPMRTGSIHLQDFPDVPPAWLDEALDAKWAKVRTVRKVVTGALEVERREKRVRSSLDAAPDVYVSNEDLRAALEGIDLAEVSITSGATLHADAAPADAFQLDDVDGVGVVPTLAVGKKCQRSWRVTPDVGSDPDYPDLSARDAAAVRQFDARQQAAE